MQRTPAHLQERFSRLIESNTLRCGVLSVQPIVLHCQLYPGYAEAFLRAFRQLFQALAPRPVHCLCSLGGPADELLPVALSLRGKLADVFPHVHLQFLCNEPGDVADFESHRLRAVFCSHNAFIDEEVYQPDAAVEKEFAAVYDARPLPFKRHHLALQVEGLGLLYYQTLGVDDPDYVAKIRHDFSHAHFFNHEEGAYRVLMASEIVTTLNRCRVGLCLSAREGGMYASMQYLLCGLSIVSTPSSGGRAEFFDERFCRVVEPEPACVARAVAEMASLRIDPWLIREVTLARVHQHRRRLMETVQSILQQSGQNRDFAREWPAVFCDKILYNFKLNQLLDLLRSAPSCA